MAAKQRKDLSIPWPFAPSEVALNHDTGLLKLVALLAMICDHAGKMLFPQYPVMRVIGRLAMPIYMYCMAAGCVYTHDKLNYFRRVVLLALISQPIYAVAMNHTVGSMYAIPFAEHPVRAALNFYVHSWDAHPSILVTLAFGMLLIYALRERQLVIGAGMFLLVWLMQNKLDYGIRGILLMMLFYAFCTKRWLSLPIVAAYMVWWGLQGSGYNWFGVEFGIQMFAVPSLILIYLHTKSSLRLPKWLWYSFYPVHLLLILILDRFVMA